MKDTIDFTPQFLNVEQVARRYNTSIASIWRWKSEGHFPAPVRVGKGCTRWRLSDLEAYEATLRACMAFKFCA